jgi:phosphomevalonate kinase
MSLDDEALVGARAPGKLVLVGEYAVLFGAPAIVTAVDRHAEARFTGDVRDRPRSPEAEGAVARVEAKHGALGRGLVVDVSALRGESMKLGLGSSAAAAVAATAAAHYARGLEPTASEIFSFAFAAHRAIQPGGSGVDVAASAYGRTLRFTRASEEAVIDPVALPTGLVVRVIFTGREASTAAMLDGMRSFQSSHPASFDEARARLAEEAAVAARAIDRGAEAFVEAAGRYGEALRAFGEHVGIPIVEPGTLAIDALAARHRGRAKPSGAGGGDVAVAFFPSEDDAARFDVDARAAGLEILSITVDAEGPRPLLTHESSR